MRLRASLPVLAVAILVLAGCGTPSSTDTSAEVEPATPEPAICDYLDNAPAASAVPPQPDEQRRGEVGATIATSAGDIDVTLNADRTPCTVTSFAVLAEQGYFDDTICHRLTTEGIFVLQCGDPSGTGTGGPGYSFDDELDGTETYPAGTLAMANAGPNTNGSQFFIVYEDSVLAPEYTVFGQVDEASFEIVRGVAAAGVGGGGSDGPPAERVEISSVTID